MFDPGGKSKLGRGRKLELIFELWNRRPEGYLISGWEEKLEAGESLKALMQEW